MEILKISVFCIISIQNITLIVASYSLTGSADYAVVGLPFTFTCNTSQNVSGIAWYFDEIAFTVMQASGTTCNTIVAPTNYTYTCSGGMLYNLTIPSVRFSQRGSKWKCDYRFGGSVSPEITLDVHEKCTLRCVNGGTLIKSKCKCHCPLKYGGETCEKRLRAIGSLHADTQSEVREQQAKSGPLKYTYLLTTSVVVGIVGIGLIMAVMVYYRLNVKQNSSMSITKIVDQKKEETGGVDNPVTVAAS